MNKRIVGYIEENKFRRFRAKLSFVGKSVSDWLREKVDEELEDNVYDTR